LDNLNDSQQKVAVHSPEELVARSQRGDSGSFRRLVEMHQGYAFALAFKILLDEEDARDTVQESFLSVWKHLREFDSHCKFTTWLYSIVANRAKDRLKSNMRRRQVVTRDWGDTDQTIIGEPLDCALANKELAERIRALAGDLPPTQRMVFVLRDLQDFSVAEVAEMLHTSQGSVKANLCYARARIRRTIEKMENVEGGKS
jgi:RNA polymerase sigma-70 factor (ECF subfamily)